MVFIRGGEAGRRVAVFTFYRINRVPLRQVRQGGNFHGLNLGANWDMRKLAAVYYK